MSRYIDADKLYDFMNRANIPYNALVQEAINFQPSIDIVRCKDCKNYVGEGKYCQLDRHCTADDFCSYGEREERSSE